MSITSRFLAFIRELDDIHGHARTGHRPPSRRDTGTRVNVWNVDGWTNAHARTIGQRDRR